MLSNHSKENVFSINLIFPLEKKSSSEILIKYIDINKFSDVAMYYQWKLTSSKSGMITKAAEKKITAVIWLTPRKLISSCTRFQCVLKQLWKGNFWELTL